jgi:serine/threonine protein kinase
VRKSRLKLASRRAVQATTLLGPVEKREATTVKGARPEVEGQLVDEGEIGSGGSGSVRRAYDPNLRRSVATKVLAPRLVKNPNFMRRFVEEARVMAQLDHPNIVPVHDLVVEERRTGYIVMKLVRGRTLEAIICEEHDGEEHADSLHHLLAAFLKVCDALAFAHSRGVIHCDLKPSNIMVGEFGEVYLMDWGIATQKSQEVESPPPGVRKNTRGTPAYMSPEQATGRVDAITERTDIFGLGAVLYFILAGRAPFDAKTATQSLTRARLGKCEDIELAAAMAPPPALARIVRKAMALDPADRFGSVLEMHHAVDEVLRSDWNLPTKVLAPGSVIIREGDFADAAYIIVRGRCAVSKMIDGEKRELRTLESGAVFGETGVLSGDERTATVEAITEVTLKVVTREVFHGRLGSDTWLGKFVMALADRFRELDAKLAARAEEPETTPSPRRTVL